jgi:hypothetical protein
MSTSNGSEEISKKKLLLLTQVGGGISKWNRFSNMSDIDKEDDSGKKMYFLKTIKIGYFLAEISISRFF